MGSARPSAPQSSNIKSGIAKGVRSTVNDPATRPEEEARAPQSWMHLAPPARPWLKRLVAFNESVTAAFLKCHIDVKRCPSGSQAASKMDCFFTSACASSAQVQRDGRARKEVDACRFRACAVLSDIMTDGIKTQLAQIWSQKKWVDVYAPGFWKSSPSQTLSLIRYCL